MQDLAYRIRQAEPSDAAALGDATGSTLAHADANGKRAGSTGAAEHLGPLAAGRAGRRP